MSLKQPSFRTATAPELAQALADARDYTLCLFESFASAGFDKTDRVPRLACLNPPLWELAHIAWFAECAILREAALSNPTATRRACLLTKGDDWFDANTVAHEARWIPDLPSTGALKMYCHEVLDRVQDKLSRVEGSDIALYPFRLALAYEDMRGEALAASLQTLGVILPLNLAVQGIPPWSQGEIRFPGGTIKLGMSRNQGFVFDNEKWAHPCYVPAFVMDSTLVSNAQYMEFVVDGGYQKPQYWTQAGRTWLMAQECSAPKNWKRDGQYWRCERFGLQVALSAGEPVRHVNLYEAQAYCMWAGRRLATEPEWEFAALSGHPALRWGDLWEWTCTPFEPYPGFSVDDYHAYSEPAFATHQVQRGASFATPALSRSVKFRNFALPESNHMFVGFRTCAV